MDDLQKTRLCAEAVGLYSLLSHPPRELPIPCGDGSGSGIAYDPLHNDAQAMALVKRLQLSVGYNGGWGAVKNDERGMLLSGAFHFDSLNRAVVECASGVQFDRANKEAPDALNTSSSTVE